MTTAKQLMSRRSTIDRIVAHIAINDGWYLLSIFAKSPSFSMVDRMSRLELASIWLEVSLPTLVSFENMSVMTFEIFGNLFLVKFFAMSKKKGRILILDFRFCLSTSLLNGSKHLLFLKKRHVLFASDFVATFSRIFCHWGSSKSISSRLFTKFLITRFWAVEEQADWVANRHKRTKQYLILILSVYSNATKSNQTTIFTWNYIFHTKEVLTNQEAGKQPSPPVPKSQLKAWLRWSIW